jgi:hypothetical protein
LAGHTQTHANLAIVDLSARLQLQADDGGAELVIDKVDFEPTLRGTFGSRSL